MPQITRNGKTFDTGDVTISLLGYLDTDVDSISYSTKAEVKGVWTLGRLMKTFTRGKVEPTAKMTMLLTGVQKLEKIAAQVNGGDTSLWKLKPFVITVNIINDDNEEITDHITVVIVSQGRDISGTDALKYDIDLFALDIQFSQQ